MRRAGQDDPVLGADGFDGLRVLGLAVLDVLGFVEHQRCRIPVRDTARRRGGAGRSWSRRGRCAAIWSKRACRSGPCRASTFKSGVNFFASATQLKTRLVGQTTKCGLRIADCADSREAALCNVVRRKARTCSVLPSPISSARMPPKPFSLQKMQPGHAVFLVGPQHLFQFAQRRAFEFGFAALPGGALAPGRRAPAPANRRAGAGWLPESRPGCC